MLNIIQNLIDYPRVAFLAVVAYVMAILGAIIMHELAHGYMAYRAGDNTAKFMGRLTLNPLKHLDPIGTLLMVIVGFGWARPVPIDPRNFREYKKDMVKVSLAGVTVNLIQALIAGLVLGLYLLATKNIDLNIYIGASQISFMQYFNFFITYLLKFAIIFNISLMVFNLLPLYPLDGFRLVETLAKPNNRYVNFMYKHGGYVLLVFLIASSLLSRINANLNIFGLLINSLLSGIDKLFYLIFKINIM